MSDRSLFSVQTRIWICCFWSLFCTGRKSCAFVQHPTSSCVINWIYCAVYSQSSRVGETTTHWVTGDATVVFR